MFAELKAIYDETRLDYFVMASTHLMNIGWDRALALTDKEIANVKSESNIMTDDFCQYLCKLAREIARVSSPVEFVQLCQVVKLYDTTGLVKRKRR